MAEPGRWDSGSATSQPPPFFYCGVLSSWRGELGAESQGRNFHPFLWVFYLPFSISVDKNELPHLFPSNNWDFGDSPLGLTSTRAQFHAHFCQDVFLIKTLSRGWQLHTWALQGIWKSSEVVHFREAASASGLFIVETAWRCFISFHGLFPFLVFPAGTRKFQVKAAEVKEQLWLVCWTDQDRVGDLPRCGSLAAPVPRFLNKYEDLAKPWQWKRGLKLIQAFVSQHSPGCEYCLYF